jgi:hypothetical protein
VSPFDVFLEPPLEEDSNECLDLSYIKFFQETSFEYRNLDISEYLLMFVFDGKKVCYYPSKLISILIDLIGEIDDNASKNNRVFCLDGYELIKIEYIDGYLVPSEIWAIEDYPNIIHEGIRIDPEYYGGRLLALASSIVRHFLSAKMKLDQSPTFE